MHNTHINTAKAISADGMSTLVDFKQLKVLKDGFTFQNIAIRPSSVGSVTLASTNPFDKPIINTGILFVYFKSYPYSYLYSCV